uniref:Calponin-homology (CH) domain-containing protein n=1 Tax=Plectus sambesii TaxID=2011161 RepID=A0A914X4P9_9BILA
MSTEVADESSSTLSGPLFVDHRFVECDEVSREICKLKAEQESKQKRTFTKWINAQLRTHWSRMFVVDLYIDIRTGVMLCYLVETVTDRKLAVNAGRRLKRIHYISNFNMVLSVLRQYGLELVNNNPVDLANGNPPIVLGLIWQIILHFEIKRTVLWLLRNDTSGVIHNAGELSVEKWLLQWLRNEIAGKYGRKVDDLDHTWKDGILFNALIHHTDSTLVDMTAIRRNSDGRRNLEHAFTVAEQRLNIPRLLDLDDVDCAQPDKRSIMTYLVQFLRKTADRKTQNSPRAADENAGAVGGINETSAGGESEEDNHFAETGPLSGPLCREDINHQLRIIQMWLETTNAFLARQTATATALNEQIDAIVNYQTQMPQIEHVLLFVEHAPKALRTDEATTELTATKQQYYNVTKPAIPAKLKALNLIKPQLITLDEKWTKLTKCLKHVADGIEAEEDINVIKDDLKEIGEELAIAQVLTDSICQQQNDQHVNVPIIMEKTRQLCSQFDILKVQLSGQVVEEEMASFQVAEQAVTELIASFEQEISADSNACTTDMRARAPSFALISTYPVLFDIGKV